MIGSRIKQNIQEAKRVRERLGKDLVKGVRQKPQPKKWNYVGDSKPGLTPKNNRHTTSSSWVAVSDKTGTRSIQSNDVGDQSRFEVSHGEIDLSDQEQNYDYEDYDQTSVDYNSKSFSKKKLKLPG
jgi:hypothetical protein